VNICGFEKKRSSGKLPMARGACGLQEADGAIVRPGLSAVHEISSNRLAVMPKQMHLALDVSWTQVESAWRTPGSWVGRHYPDVGLVITRAECDRIVETLGRALQALAID
jgi:hypothetical protein